MSGNSLIHKGCCFAEQDGRLDLKSTVFYQFLRLCSVGTLESYNDWNFDCANGIVSIYHALGYPIAANDASEYVDEDGFYFWVFQNDPESCFYCLCICSTSHIQEIGGLTSTQFDHVHGGHCKSGTIDHATDISIQLYKIQIVFPSFHFRGIFFIKISQRF